MTSKERILNTIDGRPADYAPLCMWHLTALDERCKDEDESIRRQLDLGMDVFAAMPGPPFQHHPEVRVEFRQEPAQPNPLLHKIYHTPAGDLETIVERTSDWPHGDEIPLMTDFVIPRARKFLVTGPKDLAPLRYVLADPDADGVEEFHRGAAAARQLADRHGLALRGGFNRLSDMVCWLCGCEQFATMGITAPEFLQSLIDLIDSWQRRRIELVLSERPDVLFDAQWYATTFLSPALYERFMVPALRRRVEMAHAAGARFCAIATANVMPFLGILRDLGVDVLFGLDPLMGGWDFARAKAEIGGQVCLWGGINAYLTVVDGAPADVDAAVERAMATLAPGGRFILSPVDSVRIDCDNPDARWPAVWANIERMAKTWKRLR
ncbi:MAG TPA: uroporphyrinogen decarboxylase family protein [Phycisphaerae bacterium]|nr:uroporphyrinogen decarboxylase family protein [Phycisphaerae bacterium]